MRAAFAGRDQSDRVLNSQFKNHRAVLVDMKRKCGIFAIGLSLLVLATSFSIYSSHTDKSGTTTALLRIGLTNEASAKDIIPADVICLVPAENDPFTYLAMHFPGKRADRDYDFESNKKWYVIAINDDSNVARILDIERGKIDLSFELPRCSREFVLTVRSVSGKPKIFIKN